MDSCDEHRNPCLDGTPHATPPILSGPHNLSKMRRHRLRRLLQMRFQHFQIRQVGRAQENIGKAGRNVVRLERAGEG